MNQLTVAEAAYIAGLLDGEGSVGLDRKIHRCYRPSYFAKVNINNSDYDIIQWCLDTTDIGLRSQSNRASHQKIVYVWKLRSYEIREFLYEILPYARIKKKQIMLVLEYFDNCAGTRGRTPTTEILVWQQRIYNDLRTLNKRGRVLE